MIHSGLVSVTFRKLSPREIVDLVAQVGLEGIEWGGDIHVPHGDLTQAREVRDMTLDAGRRVAAYGSYYRVGHEEPVAFETVLETAVELQAPVIRVWAGERGSDTADEHYRHLVVSASRRIAALAEAAGVTVAYEFHGHTLTDTHESTLQLLQEVARDNVMTYWQPHTEATIEHCEVGLRAILPYLSNVHVHHWDAATHTQLPLADGEQAWCRYLRVVATTGRDHFAMLEFVKDGEPAQFLRDAETLKTWLYREEDAG